MKTLITIQTTTTATTTIIIITTITTTTTIIALKGAIRDFVKSHCAANRLQLKWPGRNRVQIT